MVQVSCIYAFKIDITAGHECSAHDHTCTEIVWCDQCSGSLHQEHQTLNYTGSSVFVYQPGQEHWIKNQIAGQQICIGVHGCHAQDIQAGIYPRTQEIDALFAMIDQTLQRSHHQATLDCLAGLVALSFQQTQTDTNASPVDQAKTFIQNNLSEALSIERIAASVYLSPDYLRQLFKQELGTSLMHYVIEQRLALAQQLLRESNQNIQDIAEHCGFQSPYYFSRLFKKYCNCTPSEFRKQS